MPGVLAAVAHDVVPYSKTGLTLPTYSFFRTLSSAPQFLAVCLFKKVSLILARASAFSFFCFQERRLSNVTPRYVGFSFCGRHCPFIWSFPFWFFRDRLKMIYVVLDGFDDDNPFFGPLLNLMKCFLKSVPSIGQMLF